MGAYLFENVEPGNYQIKVSKPNNYVFTTQTNTVDNTNGAATKELGSDIDPVTGKSYVIVLSAGETENNIDAGLKIDQPASTSVGDKVWYDRNQDGIQDVGEEGIANVTVTLYNSAGSPIGSVVTDVNGNYIFDNVTPGSYSVGFSLPPGFDYAPKNAGGAAVNSDVNTTGANKGRTDAFTVIANTPITDIDCGLKLQTVGNISIGDFVWNDLDRDGLQDAGEPGIGGVKVYLFDASGTIKLDSTITASNGYYVFNNKSIGTYSLKVMPPTGYTLSASTAGTNGFIDNDFNAALGNFTAVLNLDDLGARYMEVDAGLHSTATLGTLATLGDKVWNDKNYNGILDGTEPGVPGVSVTLLDNAGNPIDHDPSTGGVQPYTVFTDANGNYLFVDLTPGTYKVKFSNLPIGTTLGNQNVGGNDAIDSDGNPNTGISDAVTLAAGANNIDLDCGIVDGVPSGKGSLGSLVWNDLDNDGIKDANEAGMPNIKVYLYSAGPDGVIGGGDDVLKDSILSNSLGEFVFTGLDADNYYVEFGNIPSGFVASPQNQGTDDNKDSDGGVITSGRSRTGIVTLSKGEDDMSTFLGLNNPAVNTFGNFVWYDLDGDGVQDSGEPGIAGVQLVLCTSTGAIYDADPITAGIQQYSTTTDKNGLFSFSNLPDGSYKYKVVGVPSGFTITPAGLGGNPALDSDVDPTSKLSSTVTLNAGNRLDESFDLGLGSTTNVILGDFVWNDINGDGIQTAAEPGIPGVTATVYDATGVTAIASAITDLNGKYLFTGLAPATYVVKFTTAPTGVNVTLQDVTTEALGTDNDANSTGVTAAIVLAAKEVNLNIDAGYTNAILAGLGDFVWQDLNNNGIQDAGEAGIPGVIVTLYNSSNVVLGSAVTDGNGYYRITNVMPGSGYYVVFGNNPPGDFTTQNVGGAGAINNSKSASNGNSSAFTIAPAAFVSNIDAGLINVVSLPVNWIYFNAIPVNNFSQAKLNWKVAESNGGDFAIWRKTSLNGAFEKTGIVSANSNVNSYSYIDNISGLTGSKIYYQVEYRANQFVSKSVIRPILLPTNSDSKITVHPNPVENNLTINVPFADQQTIEITLTDVLGKAVVYKKSTILVGSKSIQVDMNELNSGVYFVKVKVDDVIFTQKILKQ